jgi:hypothetical protein
MSDELHKFESCTLRMIAYKLVRKRANGTLSPLFIGKEQILPIGIWLEAESKPTKGYTYRPGWHCCASPIAPHLSTEGRTWVMVRIQNFKKYERPESQGGTWLIAKRLKIIKELLNE